MPKRRARVCPHNSAAYFLDSRLLNSEIARLKKTNQELRDKLAEYQCTVNQEKDDLNETINSLPANLRSRDKSSSALCIQLADAQRKADSINRTLEQMHQCESLYAQDRIQDAVECLLELVNSVNDDVRANKFIVDSLTGGFWRRALAGDEAANARKPEEAVAAYSTALSLSPLTPNAVLIKWAGAVLIRGSLDEALSASAKVCIP